MTSDWSKVDKLLEAALEREPAARAEFLKAACSEDEAVRREVESLLVAHERAGAFIETPPAGLATEMLARGKAKSMEGQRVGPYKIVAPIGAGGMGEVYLAEDAQLDRPVALKVLPFDALSDPQRMSRFTQEAKLASAINHPNICTIYASGETSDHRPFIAMEFIKGETLSAKIKGGPLPTEEIVDVGIQVADALDEAHSKGIAHRDVKPANIMITPRGQVKVLDFGLAKAAGDVQTPSDGVVTAPKTESGVVMGTVPYMSPEQALGKEIDHRSDIFSFGAVLYEMATGRQPFIASGPAEVLDRLIHSEPEAIARFNYSAPPELERIIRKCLNKDRQSRYQSARELMIDLKNLKRDADSGASGVLRRTSFQRRILVITAPIALVVAAILFVARVGHGPPASRPQIRSLAVLPLKNASGDPQDEYLSDGIAEELITRLTKLDSVRVASRSMAMRFKGSEEDAAAIGRQMGVEAVLDGTLRKSGNRLRVSVNLVGAKDGFTIWADNFDNDLGDLLGAQRQLAESLVTRLRGPLTGQERTLVAKDNTANAQSYEFLLRGKEHYRSSGAIAQPVGNPAERELAQQMFERAVQLDPGFADAHAWLALTLYYKFHDGYGDRATLEAAIGSDNKALSIDSNSIVARRALIHIYHSTGQAEEGLKQARLVVESSPEDFDALEAVGLAYFRAGMPDKAIPVYQKAISADPFDPTVRSELARCYLYTGEYQKGIDALTPVLAQHQGGEWMATNLFRALGQFDKAIEMGRRDLEKSPDDLQGFIDLGEAFRAAGQADQARKTWAEGARRAEPKISASENVRTRMILGHLYSLLGRREKASEQVRLALATGPNDPWVLYNAAVVDDCLGNRRDALDYLGRAAAHGFLAIHFLDSQDNVWNLNSLHGEPEFKAIRNALDNKVNELKMQY